MFSFDNIEQFGD